jgi:3-hydroxymyristoyl/3-hydroxydecanoyl-(acyl carrier protein) dehydratase
MNKALRWTVPVDHPAFTGHFPGMPILPGVVLLDIALSAIAAASGLPLETCTIASVKFANPAVPGDEVIIRYDIAASGTIRFDIVGATNQARTIASGSILPRPPTAPGMLE